LTRKRNDRRLAGYEVEIDMKLADVATGEIVGQADDRELALLDDKFKFLPTGLVIVDGIPAEQIKLMCENLERRGLTWHRGLAFVGNFVQYLDGRIDARYIPIE